MSWGWRLLHNSAPVLIPSDIIFFSGHVILVDAIYLHVFFALVETHNPRWCLRVQSFVLDRSGMRVGGRGGDRVNRIFSEGHSDKSGDDGPIKRAFEVEFRSLGGLTKGKAGRRMGGRGNDRHGRFNNGRQGGLGKVHMPNLMSLASQTVCF